MKASMISGGYEVVKPLRGVVILGGSCHPILYDVNM